MTDVRIIPATEAHALEIAPRLTVSRGICDAWRQMKRTQEDAVLYNVRHSTHAWAAYADNELAALFGLAARSIVDDSATPWLLPTTIVYRHRVKFLRMSIAFIAEARRIYPTLTGIVDQEHTQSIAWLKWLGFKIEGEGQFLQVTHG